MQMPRGGRERIKSADQRSKQCLGNPQANGGIRYTQGRQFGREVSLQFLDSRFLRFDLGVQLTSAKLGVLLKRKRERCQGRPRIRRHRNVQSVREKHYIMDINALSCMQT